MFLPLIPLLLLMQTSPSPQTAGNPAVRPETREIKSLVDGGLARSAAFRDLVASFDRSEPLVYVRYGVCGPRVPACTRIQKTVAYPIVVITLDPFARSRDALIALLAHELQHAREIAEAHAHAGADTVGRIERYYASRAWHGSAGFETAEAIRIGRRVEKELAEYR